MSALTVSQLNQLEAIASVAKGSGFFEGANGGEGFMGAFVDSHTGQTHYVKMLTHSSEREVAKEFGGAQFLMDKTKPNFCTVGADGKNVNVFSDISNRLRSDLIELAKKVGVSEKVAKLFPIDEHSDIKTLMSRKFVAKAVSIISKEHNKMLKAKSVDGAQAVAKDEKQGDEAVATDRKFSWDEVNAASTELNTDARSIFDYVRKRTNAFLPEAKPRGRVWGDNNFPKAWNALKQKISRTDGNNDILEALAKGNLPEAWQKRLGELFDKTALEVWDSIIDKCNINKEKALRVISREILKEILIPVKDNGKVSKLIEVIESTDKLDELIKGKIAFVGGSLLRETQSQNAQEEKISVATNVQEIKEGN